MKAALFLLVATGCGLAAEPAAAFRTDDGGDESLPWYQIEHGKFPPEESAHYFAGELIALDHVNRTGVVRTARTDKQNRSHWDLPVHFTLLPYGTLRYHGAPAALRDIPIGTHLHGLYYHKAEDEPGLTPPQDGRVSIESGFNRAFLLEDEFSHRSTRNRGWRVESFDLDAGKISVTGIGLDGGNPDDAPVEFELLPSAKIWKGKGIAAREDIAAGQIVQVNLTRATLYGPGRCTDLWIDGESRDLATERQRQIHLQYMKERGLPGWIDAVDNQNRILTVTLFGGFDPSLIKDFEREENITVAVAEPSLRSHDQINDRKSGPKLALETIPAEPGSSGYRIRCQPGELLEGFRPLRIVRLFPSNWPVTDLPREERLWPADVSIKLQP